MDEWKKKKTNRTKIYIRAVNFNEATKKAFQWWIVCSSLDTSNFMSHRLVECVHARSLALTKSRPNAKPANGSE